MSTLLTEMLNHKVTIYSEKAEGEISDVGVIERIDDQWIRLRKNDRDVLLFNIERVRLIKPFDAS